jgi:hypothetical protein
MVFSRLLKWLIWIFATVIFLSVIVLILFLTLLSSPSKEPADKLVQQSLRQNINGYKGVLEKFRKDIVEFNISYVSPTSPDRTMCGSKPKRYNCTLPIARWKEYQSTLKQLNIIWIEHENSGDRYYFVTYYESFLMNARLRGVVFGGDKFQKSYYPKQEWWPIQDEWYSFLMVE